MNLPKPSREAIEHSLELIAYTRDLITAQQGFLPFDQFMDAMLYAPGLGYYTAGCAKFGEAGDFVTAPTLSPVFAWCLAQSFIPTLQQLSQPILFELGAGTGQLAADVLTALAEQDALPDQYWILEISPDLQARQKATLQHQCPQLLDRVTWLDALPEQSFNGIIFGNEVLDALPVHLIEKQQDGWHECGVMWQEDHFAWASRPASQAVLDVIHHNVPAAQTLPVGYLTEINTQLTPWHQSVVASLKKGKVVWIDYGFEAQDYYHPMRAQGTLHCHYRHHVHDDPLIYPGLQDITAQVDFAAVLDAAEASGCTFENFQTQHAFLLQHGFVEHLETLCQQYPKDQLSLTQRAKQLILPEAMGERFKVLTLVC